MSGNQWEATETGQQHLLKGSSLAGQSHLCANLRSNVLIFCCPCKNAV